MKEHKRKSRGGANPLKLIWPETFSTADSIVQGLTVLFKVWQYCSTSDSIVQGLTVACSTSLPAQDMLMRCPHPLSTFFLGHSFSQSAAFLATPFLSLPNSSPLVPAFFTLMNRRVHTVRQSEKCWNKGTRMRQTEKWSGQGRRWRGMPTPHQHVLMHVSAFFTLMNKRFLLNNPTTCGNGGDWLS